jgi:hypothetical protein
MDDLSFQVREDAREDTIYFPHLVAASQLSLTDV